MKKNLWIGITGVGLVLALAFYFFIKNSSTIESKLGSSKILSQQQGVIDSQNRSKPSFKEEPKFQDKFLEEKKRIGQMDPNPKATKARLKALAEGLFAEDIDWLKKKALSDQFDGDERFLSAYLLAQAGTKESFPALQEIALSPVPDTKNERFRDMEVQVRAIAMEGLSRYYDNPAVKEILEEAAKKQKDDFLRDRANRSIYAWQNHTEVEKQDQGALEKLLYGK